MRAGRRVEKVRRSEDEVCVDGQSEMLGGRRGEGQPWQGKRMKQLI